MFLVMRIIYVTVIAIINALDNYSISADDNNDDRV